MHKIWLIGMHDLSNYGDCMFSHIFAYKMRGVGRRIEYVSLTGSKSIFRDAVRSVSIEEAEAQIQKGDTVIVGGGNIISDVPMTFFESRDTPYRESHTGVDLWLRGLEIAQERKCKSIIAGAGAFAPLKKATMQRWKSVKGRVDYIAWRDGSTWQIMGKQEGELIRPDMAVDKDIVRIFLGSEEIKKEDKILVNLRPRSLNGANTKSARKALEELAVKWGLPLVFHSNSYSHNDGEICKLLGFKQEGKRPITEQPKTIRESFRSIASSRLVVTSSMHTYITAVAANNPVILITRPRYNKFKGVTEACQSPGYITSSWDDIGGVGKGTEGIRGHLGDEMLLQEEHWKKVRMIVEVE
jgi:polysaccharide pyruvyl transferase WcaK-like protein